MNINSSYFLTTAFEVTLKSRINCKEIIGHKVVLERNNMRFENVNKM